MTPEDDGTEWVRQVLGSLDRPAIPQQVAQRIDAALAAASVPQQRQPGATGAATHGGAPAVRRGSWLVGAAGVAAAVVAVALIGPANGPMVPSTPDGGPVAAPQVSAGAPGTGGGGGTPGTASARPEPSPVERSVTAALMASQTAYTADTLADQVVEVTQLQASQPPRPEALPQPWSSAAGEPAATTSGAAACVAALPVPGGELLYVDRAVYEAQPVLVVARGLGDRIEVFVLGAGCTAADARILVRATVDPGE